MVNEELLQEIIINHRPKTHVAYGKEGFMCQVHYPELVKIINDYMEKAQNSLIEDMIAKEEAALKSQKLMTSSYEAIYYCLVRLYYLRNKLNSLSA